MITKAEFQANAYVIGPPDIQATYNQAGNHKKQDFGQMFGTVTSPSQYPNVTKLKIGPGADTIWLPYTQDGIDSVRLPTTGGPTFFVTANLSGCAVYIGRNDNNRLVVFHSNSQTDSDEATMGPQKPSFQSQRALRELDTHARVAQAAHHDNCRFVGGIAKSRYLSRINNLAATGDNFLGGTTVAGWRIAGNWEFWYQVWGSVNRGAVGLIHVEQFFP